MTLVVDASVAVKFFVREVKTDEARRLLEISDPLIAPDWIMAEVASAFWNKVRRLELLGLHAERHLDVLPDFFEQLFPARDLMGAALNWAVRLRHPVYDCLYLALAKREGCRLVTADGKFASILQQADLGDIVELI